MKPCAAGVAISSDGLTLVVTNHYNDSMTVFNKSLGAGHWWKVTELDLRPGKSDQSAAGVPGGAYPFWVVVKGTDSHAVAYVSRIRDREVVVVDLGGAPAVTARIRVKGQPIKMTLNAAQSRLYVVEDQSDTVDVIDTAKNAIVETIPVIAPESILPAWLARYTGANPNSVALSPDETQLYATNGNLNCVAVVALGGTGQGDRVVALIPTGWYPNSVSFSGDGNTVYVVNGKSPTGPNAGFCFGGYRPPGSPSCTGDGPGSSTRTIGRRSPRAWTSRRRIASTSQPATASSGAGWLAPPRIPLRQADSTCARTAKSSWSNTADLWQHTSQTHR